MEGDNYMSRQQRHPGANVLRILIVLLTMSMSYGTFSQVASAQTSRGTVTGIVRDPNNLVVPGAKVTLTSIDTNVSRETLTSEEGFYRFDAVDLGTYKLTVTAEGFSPLENTDITVSANQTAVVDAALKVGAIDITVSVIEDIGVALQVDAPVRGGNITQMQVTELPFQSRNPTLLALTFPGVSSSRGTQNSVDNSFSVNGARTRSNNFLIDGTENNDISVAGQGFKITNTDAVQEVSIQTSNYDAEFGRSGGAVVNTITKSGTNQFHGTLSYLLDSRVDDAITSSESRSPDIAKNGLPFGIENIVAGTLGGPIEEKKSFFFVAYQEDRKRSNTQQALIVPTAAGRTRLRELFPVGASANADFYLNATQNTVAVASPFNIAMGTVNGVNRGDIELGSFFRSISVNDPEKQLLLRADRQMTQKDNLSVRFLLDRRLIPFGSTVQVGPTFEGFDGDNNSRYYNFLIANSHVFSPLFTNETRLAYNRIDLGFPLTDPNGPSGKLPQIAFQSPPNITSLGASPSFPQSRIANNYVVQDTVTLFKSHHAFRGGVDFLRQISTQAAPFSPRGALNFFPSTGFTAFANFMDNFGGNGGTARKDFGSAIYFPGLYRTATFFQDRWRATPSLTLTLGLRYEYFGTPFNTLRTPAFAGLFNVVPVTRFGPYALPNKVKADRNNFSPTVGIAYSPSRSSGPLGFLFGEKRSVFRAGYYIGYDSFFNNIASNAATSSPNIISTTTTSAVSSTDPRGFPNFLSTIETTAALDPTSSQTVIAPDLVNPYYQRWSAGIQRELPHGIVLDISYVGSKGTKLYVTEDANPRLADPQLRFGTPSPLPPSYPTCTPGSMITAAQAIAGFPKGTPCPLTGRFDNLQGSRSVRTNGGSSIYHAGQVEVKRRLASNFIVTGAYTYSKLISNMDEVATSSSSGILNQNFSQTPFIFGGERLDRAVSLFDRTHRASITYVVQSPFMKNQRGVVGHILGGYELSGVTVFESGVPFTVFNGLDSDGIGGSTTDRPNVNPNGRRGVRAKPDANSITGYVNPDDNNAAIDPSTAYFIGNPAYSPGTVGSRLGTLGLNTERTPGTINFDVSILKRTRISESKTVEFRTEF